ncbi:ferrous iron transport protein B [Faecalibaculum rodentium]|uniref:Ferrous iron transport protein B n=6 Tax=Faecalibaculum rodentium TaxID=1702221 RepID=A0A140DVV8_9FIRM|nr:ferrous iron transport protein B [Faecalibaculum rodentium]AMK54785.1 iron transporter FeoB [Faecalibaculum rodentium]
MKTIALAGNPNSGKTTLFNALTGSRQHTGNWPGVTVEKKEGRLKNHEDILIQDLPGIYSLSPYTLEEVVSRAYLVKEQPDMVLDIVDGTNIERNLYLTTQLLELNLPVVLAVNMADMVRASGNTLDLKKLSAVLGCPVISISALKKEGLDELTAELAKPQPTGHCPDSFEPQVVQALEEIQKLLADKVPPQSLYWYAVKAFERDERVLEELHLDPEQTRRLEAIVTKVEKEYDDDAESILTTQRYDYIERILAGCFTKKATASSLSLSDKIDRVVTNRWLALPVFVLIMWGIYTIAMGQTVVSIGTMGTDWVNDVLFGEWIPNGVETLLTTLGVGEVLSRLIQDGIVAGVGAVLGFVPQILVLFFLLSILEDCGYMSRVAFIMDRLFRRFGLSGKSFIPLLVVTGCGVPGIMASRTIEQDRDRKLTIMTTGFIPCGAKMPIIGLFAGAVFGQSAWVATSAFVIGIGAVVVSGIILKKFKVFAGEPAPFVMELPAYHWPTLTSLLASTWERGWSFIKRAGTLILASSIILWFLQSFGIVNGSLSLVEDNNVSLLAGLGHMLAWIFVPLGWAGDMAWKATVATFTGLIAKEEVVNTFGVLYAGLGEVSEEGTEIWAAVAADFSAVTAWSFLIFNLLCAPCFAAMGAIKREMNNWKWTLASIGYMCGFAYVVSLIVYQIGGLFTGEVTFSVFSVVAFALLGLLLVLLFRKGYSGRDDTIHTAMALESGK